MNLLVKFQRFINEQNLFSSKDKLLLAVSGGLDSVVLCELCNRSGFDFSIAHCNFQLRDGESERDEVFVKLLAENYGKDFMLRKFDTKGFAEQNKLSIQVAARELRYGWFEEIVNGEEPIVNSQGSVGNRESFKTQKIHATSHTHHYILTAHHLDDSIETLLMNFFKGTGIAGLHGILPKQGNLVRPLLFAKREDIKAFALENQLHWVEDSSNESDKYTRNYFRHQIIPMIEKIYPGAINNISSNIDRFREVGLLYSQSIVLHKKRLLEQKGNEVHIPILKLRKAVPLRTILYEIIKDYGFSSAQVDEVLNLLESGSGKYIQSATHRIIKNRNWLILSPKNSEKAQTIIVESPEGSLSLAIGKLQFERVSIKDFKLQTSNQIGQLDFAKIKFPLLLRKWKKGDYFYPLGMKKKKKIARFLIDNKVSQTEKENIWLVEMDKKIIWVVGMRIDERFKVSPSSKDVLRIFFSK